jgi:hypothetical protein
MLVRVGLIADFVVDTGRWDQGLALWVFVAGIGTAGYGFNAGRNQAVSSRAWMTLDRTLAVQEQAGSVS